MMPYDYYDYSYVEPAAGTAALGGIAGFLAVFFGLFYLIMFGFSIACYVLNALGLYTTAKRRGIRNPWLSWIPVGDVWILGSLSDQYQYVKKGKIRNRRKILLGLSLGVVAAAVAIIVACAAMVISEYDMAGGEMLFGSSLALVLLGYFAMMVLALVGMVFTYIAYYDYFASCDPGNAVLYLVLSIFISVTLPFFVFFNRKKDQGMPPRKQEQPPVIETVAAEPVAEAPAESVPVENTVDQVVPVEVEAVSAEEAENSAQPEE